MAVNGANVVKPFHLLRSNDDELKIIYELDKIANMDNRSFFKAICNKN